MFIQVTHRSSSCASFRSTMGESPNYAHVCKGASHWNIWPSPAEMCQGEPLLLPLLHPPLPPFTRHKRGRCCSGNALAVREGKETHQSIEANSPRGEKFSLAHIMTNSCRLFGFGNDNGRWGWVRWEGGRGGDMTTTGREAEAER